MSFFDQFTPEQMRAQYSKNAQQLREMAAIAALAKNGKCNGFTAEELSRKAAEFESKAASA